MPHLLQSMVGGVPGQTGHLAVVPVAQGYLDENAVVIILHHPLMGIPAVMTLQITKHVKRWLVKVTCCNFSNLKFKSTIVYV